MPNPLVLLCPGQGAQAVAMGRAWCEASPEARAVFDLADRILTGDAGVAGASGSAIDHQWNARVGAPLSTLCFEGPAETLNRTDVSQPAIFVTSVACWAGLAARWGVAPDIRASETPIVAAAGLSLGEYTALLLAGAIGFEDALRLVALRGRAMQDAAEAVPSGMVALIGADEASAQAVCDATLSTAAAAGDADQVLVPANFNAPGQIVISGSKAACERAVAIAAEEGLRATALPVAGAFHSPIMAPAAERLGAALAGTTIHAPACPVMSNVTARPHGRPHVTPHGTPHDTGGSGESAGAGAAGSGTMDPSAVADSIRRRLVEQLTSPVRWAEGCEWLVREIVTTTPGVELHELAPGKTLAGLMRRIDKSAKVASHDGPND
ncbi:MAG: ACP S-malonyltransferase [Phycisphaerales bacterium]